MLLPRTHAPCLQGWCDCAYCSDAAATRREAVDIASENKWDAVAEFVAPSLDLQRTLSTTASASLLQHRRDDGCKPPVPRLAHCETCGEPATQLRTCCVCSSTSHAHFCKHMVAQSGAAGASEEDVVMEDAGAAAGAGDSDDDDDDDDEDQPVFSPPSTPAVPSASSAPRPPAPARASPVVLSPSASTTERDAAIAAALAAAFARPTRGKLRQAEVALQQSPEPAQPWPSPRASPTSVTSAPSGFVSKPAGRSAAKPAPRPRHRRRGGSSSRPVSPAPPQHDAKSAGLRTPAGAASVASSAVWSHIRPSAGAATRSLAVRRYTNAYAVEFLVGRRVQVSESGGSSDK